MEYYTIWSGSAVRAALTVKMGNETAGAIQFVVADNAKCTFWLPKSSLKWKDGQYQLAFWFTKTPYLKGLFDRYATHYKA